MGPPGSPIVGPSWYTAQEAPGTFFRMARRFSALPNETNAMATAAAHDDRLHFADVERRLKAIFIGSVGNLLGWCDLCNYTALALYFAGAFFPNSNPVVQQLNAAVLFAAGFIVRPLGGWLFGNLADRYG